MNILRQSLSLLKSKAFCAFVLIFLTEQFNANLTAGAEDNNLGDYPWTATSKDGMKGMTVAQKELTDGYVVELSIPWDSIQVKI